MRAALVFMVVCVLVVPASSVGRPSLAPPPCSALDTKEQKNVYAPSRGNPVYIRHCGPARALVRLNGRAYRIRGGHCRRQALGRHTQRSNRLFGGIEIGFIANEPARPGLGIDFWWDPPSTMPGRVTIDDSEIEIPGKRVAASGTVIVGRKLSVGDVGWFSLYGRTADGPTGDRVTGSWACG
jgi:hypothetical protein